MSRLVVFPVILVVASACSSGNAAGGPTQEERLADASRGLCDALLEAERGDVAAASRVFQDRVHAYLHDLARRLSDFDRVAAGELLEAKQRLEAALRDGSGAETVRDLILGLQRELADAARAAGLPQHACLVDAA